MREWGEVHPERVIPLLQTVSGLVERRCDKFLTQHYSLTMPQFQLLLAAVKGEEMTLGSLSDQLGCSRGNVTGIVDRLERDGWLVRERSTADRRVVTVRLTDKGSGIMQIKETVGRELAALAEVWTAQEREILVRVLGRLYEELKS